MDGLRRGMRREASERLHQHARVAPARKAEVMHMMVAIAEVDHRIGM